jgi:hypothetical protein
MVLVDNLDEISGYFHIMKKDNIKMMGSTLSHYMTTINPAQLSVESLGQIKIRVATSNINLKAVLNNAPMG